ncbi:MAG TPA: glycerol-3-phosphate 1-O-acyltransferase PlsY [Paenibacillaceae bacterium]
MPYVVAIISVIASYLIGSVSFSIVLGRLLKGIDIRQHGSGNAGATNTLRVLGIGPGIAVFVLDTLKGTAAVALGWWAASGMEGAFAAWVPVLSGLAAVAGHNWPVYFLFRGGKGIATTIGVMAPLAFWPMVISGAAAVAVIALTRYVSLGSLVMAASLPALAAVFRADPAVIAGAVVIAVLAFIRHRRNIVRLATGTENRLGGRKKGESHDA